MGSKRLVGIVLVIIGVALAVWGYDIYQSAGSQFTRALGGESPARAWIGMVSGALCVAVGIFRLK